MAMGNVVIAAMMHKKAEQAREQLAALKKNSKHDDSLPHGLMFAAKPRKKGGLKLAASASEPCLPTPGVVPRCAESETFKMHQKKAIRRREELKKEEIKLLDFHGFAGDVAGFKAFLAHKFGLPARGWRKAVAPDEMGIANVFHSDFALALHKLGYGGNASSLWQALTQNKKSSVYLKDFEPQLSANLDLITRRLFKSFTGGAQEAWQDIEQMPRKNMLRINFDEFSEWVNDIAALLKPHEASGLRQIFEVLDMSGCGTVTEKDLRFFDHWAQKRFRKKLPPSLYVDPRDLPEPEHWSPPPPKKPPEPTIADFRKFLEIKFGSAGRAWRVALDLKGVGAISISDFGKGCRSVGWKPAHAQMYAKLQEAGHGLVRLRALDPALCKAIDDLKDIADTRFGGIEHLWAYIIDPGQTGTISRVEFLTEMRRALGVKADAAKKIFMILDTAGTGWVAQSEFAWLQVFETGLPTADDLDVTQFSQALPASPSGFSSTNASWDRQVSSGSRLAPMPQPNTTKVQEQEELMEGSLGSFKLPWQGRGPQAPDFSSPTGRELWAPHRSSRSCQYRALANTHQLKHRFLATAAEDRCIYVNHEHVMAHKRVASQAVKSTSAKDIFRHSSEFYRAAQDRLLKTITGKSVAEDEDDYDDDEEDDLGF
eukprot:TRINITY_DN47989_c0_g1_i1.p1 TRINITY_DN47989_c0_g1~~TRINITY_DN47989_c0_g1_i1.p1  ORF type:complete len:654 (-),score=120.92 TRINITY_DN47989_c0_g1_i1:51-2012(-)